MLGLGRRPAAKRGGTGSIPQIDADLSGAMISGQVAIGEHIVQIHAEHGAVVNYRAARATPCLRETPVRRLPRPFDDLLGRADLLHELRGVLAAGGPAALVGEAGIGKTSLLRNVANHLAELQPDGVVYTAARGLPAGDMLQFLFECFYDCGGEIVVATGEELARYLGDRRALIVIDDAELDRDALASVMDVASQSTFLLASSARQLWGEGRSFVVAGLDETAASTLLERELGRQLASHERPVAASWCRALDGSPLRILQLGGLLHVGALSLGAVAGGVLDLTPGTLEQLLVRQLPEEDRRVLAPLAAISESPVPTATVAASAEDSTAASRLAELERRHVVEAHSPRYTLAGGLSHALDCALADAEGPGWRDVARSGLMAATADAGFGQGTSGDAEAELLLALLRDAARRGSSDDVLALARAADRLLALRGRWGGWQEALDAGLAATQDRADPAERAWVLHQLGSRALAVGERDAAAERLGQALELREALGDHAGASVTRHNLDLLSGPPPGNHGPPKPRPRLPLVAMAAALVAVAAGVGVAAGVSGGGGPKRAALVAVTTTTSATSASSTASAFPTSTSPPPSTTSPTSTTREQAPPLAFQQPIQIPVSVIQDNLVQGSADATATNNANAPLVIQDVAFAPADEAYHVRNECRKSLAPGAQCQFLVSVTGNGDVTPAETLSVTIAGAQQPVNVTVTLCARKLLARPATSAPSSPPSNASTDTTSTTSTTTSTTATSVYPACPAGP